MLPRRILSETSLTATKPLNSFVRPRVSRMTSSAIRRQQLEIATRSRRVHRIDTLGRKAREIVRPARLRPGAGQAFAAERLHADHGSDHVAVDVDVPDARAEPDVLGAGIDALVHAQRQPEPGR